MPDQQRQQSAVQREANYKVLRAIDANPSLSQRQLAKQLGISLGKANYCLKALLELGWIKTRNFKNSQNKIAYAYLLTTKGAEQKVKLTIEFLQKKQEEFEMLRCEIQQLSEETSMHVGRRENKPE